MNAAAEIKFLNLLDLARFAFKAGAYARAEEHLQEARTLVAYERRIAEDLAS
jgi:hypothetical protein